MRELKLLINIQWLRLFGMNKLKYLSDCPEKKKLRTNLIMYIVLGVVMLPTVFTYFIGMASILESQGQIDMLIALAITVSSFVVVITSIFNAANTLFVFSDFDTTVSLPISLRIVALSRLLKLYGTNLFFTAYIMLPVLGVYAIYKQVTLGYALLYLVFVIITPMLPVVIAAFISVVFTKLTSKLNKKNTANLVLSVLFTGLLALFVIFSGSIGENFDSIVLVLTDMVERIYPMSLWLANGLSDLAALPIIGFAAINIIPFALFTLLLGKMLKPMNSVLTSNSGSHTKLEKKNIVTSSAFKALVNKDVQRFFSSIGCFMNVAIGYLILLAGSIILIISGGEILKPLYEMPGMAGLAVKVAPFIAAMAVGLTNPNAAVISLEGKSLWQLKALPLSMSEIMRAKLSVGLLTSMPVTLISMVLIAITLKASAIDAAFIILVPLVQALFSSVFALKINFEHPKFDWVSEVETVKQGSPILLTMLIGFVAPAIPAALVFFAGNLSNIVCALYIVVELLLSLIIWRSLSGKKAELKFYSMN